MSGQKFIIWADYNTKHTIFRSRITNFKGKAIEEIECEIKLTEKSAYWSTDCRKIPYQMVFFLIKNVSCNCLYIDESYYLFSDHSAIKLNLRDSLLNKEINSTLGH